MILKLIFHVGVLFFFNLNFLRKQRLYRLFSSPLLVIISELMGQFHANSRLGRGLNVLSFQYVS